MTCLGKNIVSIRLSSTTLPPDEPAVDGPIHLKRKIRPWTGLTNNLKKFNEFLFNIYLHYLDDRQEQAHKSGAYACSLLA